MPLALLLIVGILYVGTVDRQENKLEVKKNSQVLITTTLKNNPTIEEVKVEPKEPEIIKEEVKVEPKEPEIIKEEVKVEPKEPETVKEEVDVTESPKSYLGLVLYIIVGLLVVFTGMYFFSNRRGGQLAGSTVDNSRVDIEENIASETQEQQPTEETTQPETQEQQPTEETTQPETQEQQPVEDETQSDKTEQRPVEEDENNNK
jgi:hypothetical protein